MAFGSNSVKGLGHQSRDYCFDLSKFIWHLHPVATCNLQCGNALQLFVTPCERILVFFPQYFFYSIKLSKK